MPTPTTNWKEATDTNAGSAAVYGAPDVKKFSQYYNGVLDVDDIDINSDTWFRNSKLYLFDLSNDHTVQLLTSEEVADRTLTIPVLGANDTIATLGTTQTLSGAKTFSSVLTMSGANIDVAGNNIENSELPTDTNFFVDSADETKKLAFGLSGFTTTTTRTVTVPDADFTVGGLSLTQTWSGTNTFARTVLTGRFEHDKGADVASGDAITLGTDGNVFDITGTTTINHINNTNWQIGSYVILHFDGAVTLTHNAGTLAGDEADLFLSGDTNYTTSAGDILTFILHDATSWQEISRNSAGAVSLTPWTSDIDADGFDLNDLSNIEFRTTTGAPTAGTQAIYADAGGIIFNVPTGDRFEWSVNDVDIAVADVTDGLQVIANRVQTAKGSDVASAGTITLGNDGNVFDITGTTTINEITPTNWQAGSIVVLQFDGALQLTHNSGGTNDILLGNQANWTTSAGDTIILFYNGTDWVEIARSEVGGAGGSDTPWTVNHDFDVYYYDMQNQTKPVNPATNNGRYYQKAVDANNDALFVIQKKAGSFVEVQVS